MKRVIIKKISKNCRQIRVTGFAGSFYVNFWCFGLDGMGMGGKIEMNVLECSVKLRDMIKK